MMILSALVLVAGSLATPTAVLPQDPASVKAPAPAEPQVTRAVIAPEGDLDGLTLVRSSSASAVVRIGGAGSSLVVLAVGDRVGRTAATVRAIAPGRLVVEELTRDDKGRPRNARIIFREGHTGGRRFTRDPGQNAPVGVRPEVLGPDGKPLVIKKSGKTL